MACCYLLRIDICGLDTLAEISWAGFATLEKVLLVLQRVWLSVQHTFGSLSSCLLAICLCVMHYPPLGALGAAVSGSSRYLHLLQLAR